MQSLLPHLVLQEKWCKFILKELCSENRYLLLWLLLGVLMLRVQPGSLMGNMGKQRVFWLALGVFFQSWLVWKIKPILYMQVHHSSGR